ncbi:hypothetical protein [Plantactinospora sp. B5E13]|uniref:hypothetical protein n=1 Tax=unclassified Plantactinospora TaxID=2631981 RepID=UPI00325F034F
MVFLAAGAFLAAVVFLAGACFGVLSGGCGGLFPAEVASVTFPAASGAAFLTAFLVAFFATFRTAPADVGVAASDGGTL